MITENMGTYKKHHTVQVAMCAYSFVRTLVNVLVRKLQQVITTMTVQLVLVVFSFHQLAKILHLQSWLSSSTATCAGGVFS